MQLGITLLVPTPNGQGNDLLITWRTRLPFLTRVELAGVSWEKVIKDLTLRSRRALPLVLVWKRFWALDVPVSWILVFRDGSRWGHWKGVALVGLQVAPLWVAPLRGISHGLTLSSLRRIGVSTTKSVLVSP